jgi:tRNA threonylcarbamoyladenosine biosynthesis protein TsaB
MRLLAFDTATAATAVAVADGDSVLERRDDPPAGARPRHTSRLMALIAELLEEAGWDWDQLDRVAVGVGPGTFTGLRIGIATARGLAQARGLELVGVSTLESLSLNADAENVCAVLDARRGEVFAAAWSRRRSVLQPATLDPVALAERLSPGTLAIGEGAVAFRHVLERSGALIPDDGSDLHRVTAVNHCRLGLLAEPSDTDAVRPEYLRLPDAEIARKQ